MLPSAKRKKKKKPKKYKPVHAVSEQDSDAYQDIMTTTEANGDIKTVNQMKEKHSQSQQLKMMKKLVNFQIECGATCNVIPIQLLNPETQLEHTEKVLVMYIKTWLHPLNCDVKIRSSGKNNSIPLEGIEGFSQLEEFRNKCVVTTSHAQESLEGLEVNWHRILCYSFGFLLIHFDYISFANCFCARLSSLTL